MGPGQLLPPQPEHPRGLEARLAYAILIAVLGGTSLACGASEDRAAVAPPQTLRLGWHERDRPGDVGFALEVRSVRLTAKGWSVEAAVTNRTPVTWRVSRPHVRGGTKFGLFVLSNADSGEWEKRVAARQLTPALIANRFEPPLPRLFRPGTRWTGTFSGRGTPVGGTFVRVAFGRFVTTQTPPAGLPKSLLVVTSRAARVAP